MGGNVCDAMDGGYFLLCGAHMTHGAIGARFARYVRL